jgi:hypothetical protein
MDNQEIIGLRDRKLSSTEKHEECPNTCGRDCTPPLCSENPLAFLQKSYESYHSLGVTAFSALSIGTCVLSVLTMNGFISLLSCNSVFSILSLNSAFSVLSTNSAFAVGCVDKRFAICF